MEKIYELNDFVPGPVASGSKVTLDSVGNILSPKASWMTDDERDLFFDCKWNLECIRNVK